MKNKGVQITLTLILSALALYVALKDVKFGEVAGALRQVQLGWIFVTLVLIFLTLLIRAERWRILLGRKVSLRDAFGLINIGYLVSGVLPLRAGDPARAVAASLRGPVSPLAALSVVVVERVLDMGLVLLMMLGTLPFVEGMRTYLATGKVNSWLSNELALTLVGVMAFGLLAAFLLVAFFPIVVERIARWILEKLHIGAPERWLRPLRSMLDGLAVLRSPRDGLAIILWSLALWMITPAYFWTVMQACSAFLPSGNLALQSVVATWASAFGMVFPAVGGLGSFHAAVSTALSWGFAIPGDLGVTYAIVVHALPYLTGIILGAITLLVWGVSFKSLVSQAQTVEKKPTE
ncbi:MAG: flippase-like domain-containing protein [Anaerolineae bacterium]|nr:flippase-like domain-containing protein [Anaerolineae bacterium]